MRQKIMAILQSDNFYARVKCQVDETKSSVPTNKTEQIGGGL